MCSSDQSEFEKFKDTKEIVPIYIKTSVDDIYFEITHLMTGAHFRNSIFSLRSRLQNNRKISLYFYLLVLFFVTISNREKILNFQKY